MTTVEEESSWDEPQFDAEKLTPAIRKKLRAISIPAPGKSDRMVKRCFNLKAWRVQQEAARKANQKSAADRSSNRATAAKKKSAAELSPAQLKQRAADRTRQLTERVKAWRHAWLKRLVADRLDQHPVTVQRMRAWLQCEPFGGMVSGELNLIGITIRQCGGKPPTYRDSAAVWRALSNCDTAKIDELSVELVRSVLLHEDRDKKYPRLKWEHVESLALMAKIDVAKEWIALQRGTEKAVEFETFFLLHDKGQLEEVAAQLKVNIHGLVTKKHLVARLVGQPRALPLPKAIAPLKAAKKAKGRSSK